MRNYVKPTIGDIELRPEEGLACVGSEGGSSGGGYTPVYPDISNVVKNIDWDYVISLITSWLKRRGC